MKPEEPSATARLIAAATVYSSRRRNQAALVPAEAAAWCERLLAASPSGRRLLASVRSPVDRAVLSLLERLTLPGITRHYQLRKRWIERAWEQAAGQGFHQLLVLGAGLDTLALREAERDPALLLTELDHPATQGVKRQALPGSGPTSRIRFVPADLAQLPIAEALAAPSMDPAESTFVVAEGLLMYLQEPSVRSLLRSLADLPQPRVRLAMTHMDRIDGRPLGFTPHSRLVGLWLRLRGEPFQWSASDAEVRVLLEECGWRVLRQVRSENIAQDLDLPAGRELKGENLVLAERSAGTR